MDSGRRSARARCKAVAAALPAQLCPLKVIAITGSNGKTSTKDFTAAVLAERFRVVKTEGNLNNHIGLPQTILRASSRHEMGVFELGMNHPGEIAPLAGIAGPDAAIITNIGVAHIGLMGGREAIAREKGMLAEAVGPEGHVVLNADDEFSKAIGARTRARVVFAGIGCGEVRVTEIRPQPGGSRFTLQAGGESVEGWLDVPGVHMIQNATLAVAAGRVFGLTLAECVIGLQKAPPARGRLEPKTVSGIRFLDDSYNANPDSMLVAIRTLVHMPDSVRRIAVLGQMNELGDETESGHRQVGEAAAREALHCVISVGELAAQITDAAREGGVSRPSTAHHRRGRGNSPKASRQPGGRSARQRQPRRAHGAGDRGARGQPGREPNPKQSSDTAVDVLPASSVQRLRSGDSMSSSTRHSARCAAAMTAFLLCLMFGNRVIRRLISLKFGQPIRTKEEVHKLAEAARLKKGTPTMGGVLLLGATVVSTLLWANLRNGAVWLVLFRRAPSACSVLWMIT